MHKDMIRRFQQLQVRILSAIEEATLGTQAHHRELAAQWEPPVDVYETETTYVFSTEVPGVEQSEVDLKVRDRFLFLRGKRAASTKSSKSVYYRLEQPAGIFERRFRLPAEVNADQVQAVLNDGVLTVTLPKKQSGDGPKRVPVTLRGR